MKNDIEKHFPIYTPARPCIPRPNAVPSKPHGVPPPRKTK